MKSLYAHIREAWKKPKATLGELWRQRLIEWRRTNTIIRIEKPTRLDRARALGYKAKQGIIIARVRILRGGRKRPRPRGGRRSKRMGIRKVLKMNYQWVAEARVARKFRNCEILNSYWVAKDGQHYWFEVILVDRNSPVMQKDKQLSWITTKQGRVFRGLTSAARKSKGLRKKGNRAIKVRPSQRANKRQGK
ncbi:MAG: 50S ribosomal protein L15e [archaeon]